MVGIVILKKNGNVSNSKVNTTLANVIEALKPLTKLKMKHELEKLYTWDLKDSKLTIYGWKDGRVNQENTHDLPPSAIVESEGLEKSDTQLLFGDLFAIKHKDDEMIDININDYAGIYSDLFGGFEDLGSEDSYSDCSNDTVGSLKDFIAGDGSELSYDDDYLPDSSSDSGSDSSEENTEGESESTE